MGLGQVWAIICSVKIFHCGLQKKEEEKKKRKLLNLLFMTHGLHLSLSKSL